MIISRIIEKSIKSHLQANKVVVIYGSRQVGKTTLINKILKDVKEKYLFLSGEDRKNKWLSSQSIDILQENIANNKLLVIDEAQKIDNIGLNLKLIVDHIKNIKVLVTGSSSFDLSNQVGEPLVGRKWQFNLFPISQLELNKIEEKFETKSNLNKRLIYGSFPEVIINNNIAQKKEILNSLVDNYLFKDLLQYNQIKKADKILDLLKLLCWQIGKEVSLTELANNLDLNSRTVEKYLDLLEKVFVIKKINGFSRNLRKEITKNSRYYFYDNGIRNAIINNFNEIENRNDVGELWENYLFIERLKKQEYKRIYSNNYFWRTYDKKEIDLVEERDGKLYAYEFKWGKKKAKKPTEWLKTYKEAEYEVINQDNYLNFIS
jgi:uncharacterized protein